MSEAAFIQRCPMCSNTLPARGYFCASCATQARCKTCGELLEPGAKACVMCGAAVGNGSPASPSQTAAAVPMNTLELQEDTKSRSLRMSFTDTAISNIGEAVNQIVFDRVMQRASKVTRHVTDDGYRQQQLLPAPPIVTNGSGSEVARNAEAAAVVVGGDAERIKQVFEAEGEDFRLEEHRLKADSRMEYARRLTYLYIYAHELAGRKPIQIAAVRRMLDACKVLDHNTRHEIARKMALEISGEEVRLKREGRERAIAALDQILDSGVADPGWTPESQARTPKGGEAKDSKPAGKPGRKKSTVPDEWAAKWEKLSDKPNAHFALKDKGILEKSICGLWAIHKVGGKVASFLFLQRFIAEAFSFRERERSIEKALTRDTAKDFVIKADGGVKLTPSGTKRAEELLKAK